jgi:hypothetical protein
VTVRPSLIEHPAAEAPSWFASPTLLARCLDHGLIAFCEDCTERRRYVVEVYHPCTEKVVMCALCGGLFVPAICELTDELEDLCSGCSPRWQRALAKMARRRERRAPRPKQAQAP